MSGANYRLNTGAFRRGVLQADWMVAEMERRADKVLEACEATAPEETGHYRESFRRKTRKRGGVHKDRAEARVVNTDPAALAIEFGHFTAAAEGEGAAVPFARGGRFVDGHYTMTRAIDAAGD